MSIDAATLERIYSHWLSSDEFKAYVNREINNLTSSEIAVRWRKWYFEQDPNQKTNIRRISWYHNETKNAALQLGAAVNPKQLVERLQRLGIHNERRREYEAENAEWEALEDDVKREIGRDGFGIYGASAKRDQMIAAARNLIRQRKASTLVRTEILLNNNAADLAKKKSAEEEAAAAAAKAEADKKAAERQKMIGIGIAAVAVVGVGYFVFIKK